MTVNITLVGLGRIGASIGLALASHTDQLYRRGHDRHPEHARRAQKMGAIDKVAYNLPRAVADADIVLLALPIDQVRETLEIIAPDLKEGAVVMDTSPLKTPVFDWADELLPQGRYLIGLTPALNPERLQDPEFGIDGARDDLFSESLMGIVAPGGTLASAMKLATDLTALLGAEPFYLDRTEVDGLMASVHLAPQLIAAAMMATTSTQPGWQEGRKIAAAHFAQSSAPMLGGDDAEALSQAMVLGKDHVARVLDTMIAALTVYKERTLASDQEGLVTRLKLAEDNRARWWNDRVDANWDLEQIPEMDAPSSGDEMRRMIVGRRREE
jgi:prephenate dehydrogenase